MRETEPRWECPVCVGTKLIKVRLVPDDGLVLDHCTRCGGMWFDRGEVDALRQARPQIVPEEILLSNEEYRVPCHGCGARIDRNVATCPGCERPNVIRCPVCRRDLEQMRRYGFVLDVCRHCMGVWFDGRELAEFWNREVARAVRSGRVARRYTRPRPRLQQPDTDREISAFDALVGDPFITVWALDAGGQVAGAAAHGVASGAAELPEMIGAVPEAAGGAVEGVAELARTVFETVAEIIGGIFS